MKSTSWNFQSYRSFKPELLCSFLPFILLKYTAIMIHPSAISGMGILDRRRSFDWLSNVILGYIHSSS